MNPFEEKPGVLSTARIILWLVFVICVVAPVVTVLVGSWGKPEWVKPDASTLDFCKWAFVAALGGKVSQAVFGEKDTPPPPAEPPAA